jgi:hypothetical protein
MATTALSGAFAAGSGCADTSGGFDGFAASLAAGAGDADDISQ